MKYLPLLLALLAAPAHAQFAPQTVDSGWSSIDLKSENIDGTLRVSWKVTAGLGNLTVVCGAFGMDNPELAPLATAALAKSSASEGGRVLLTSLSHFANAGDLDALNGSSAPCKQTTAVSTSGVTVTIYEGEVLVPAPAPASD